MIKKARVTSPLAWYEADWERLVAEVECVRQGYPTAFWGLINGDLCCETSITAEGLRSAVALKVRLVYPGGFPITPIRIYPIEPEIPLSMWNHEWHRWYDGSLCLCHPSKWDVRYTGDDVLGKASEWYFNFLTKLFGAADSMPDLGKAPISHDDLTAAIDLISKDLESSAGELRNSRIVSEAADEALGDSPGEVGS